MAPALKGRLPFLYLEYGALRVQGTGVVFAAKEQEIDVPVARIASLLMGPGTTVSHAAVRKCAQANTLLQWVGEEGTTAYATSDPLTSDAQRLKEQMAVAMNPRWRAKAIRYMFVRRFGGTLALDLDENAVRGMEGSRVKGIYQTLAAKHGLNWFGRKTGHGGWEGTDSLNQAISIANGHLMQVATVAVLAAGFSPAVGFLHTGFNRAYSSDIADLHKFQTTVPLAFEMVARGMSDPRKEIRHAVRDLVAQQSLLDKMIKDALEVVGAGFGRV